MTIKMFHTGTPEDISLIYRGFAYTVWELNLLEELDNIKGLEVYTPEGIFVGKIGDVVLDVSNKKIDGLFIDSASPVLVDKNVSVKIPFKWVQSIGDIVILKAFPEHITRTGIVS